MQGIASHVLQGDSCVGCSLMFVQRKWVVMSVSRWLAYLCFTAQFSCLVIIAINFGARQRATFQYSSLGFLSPPKQPTGLVQNSYTIGWFTSQTFCFAPSPQIEVPRNSDGVGRKFEIVWEMVLWHCKHSGAEEISFLVITDLHFVSLSTINWVIIDCAP